MKKNKKKKTQNHCKCYRYSDRVCKYKNGKGENWILAGFLEKGIQSNLYRNKKEKKKGLYNSSLGHNCLDIEVASISNSQKGRMNAQSKPQVQSDHQTLSG